MKEICFYTLLGQNRRIACDMQGVKYAEGFGTGEGTVLLKETDNGR